MTIDASIIIERDRQGVNKEDDCEFIDDESDNEADNEDEYTEDEQFVFLVVYYAFGCYSC